MAKLRQRYAKELFSLSKDANRLEEDLQEANLMKEILDDKDIQLFLINPHIPKEDKHDLLHNALREIVNSDLLKFISRIIDNNRETLILPVLNEFIKIANQETGRIHGQIVSAIEIDPIQLERIQAILSEKTQMKVTLNPVVDPEVIGGFYIHIDGFIFDRTIRTELNNLTRQLKREGVANGS